MRKNKRRNILSEQCLDEIVRRCVKDNLNENQGVWDGIKGAWNGFKGGLGYGHAKYGLGQGYKQGAQEQQDVIDFIAHDMVKHYLSCANKYFQRARTSSTNSDTEGLLQNIRKVIDYCRKIEVEVKRKASDGVDYREMDDGAFVQH